jgi:hypothetical protein
MKEGSAELQILDRQLGSSITEVQQPMDWLVIWPRVAGHLSCLTDPYPGLG